MRVTTPQPQSVRDARRESRRADREATPAAPVEQPASVEDPLTRITRLNGTADDDDAAF